MSPPVGPSRRLARLGYRLAAVANRAIPKDPRRVLFLSHPDFADNSWALYRHLRAERSGDHRFAWLVTDEAEARACLAALDPDGPVIEIRRAYSPGGFWLFARSRWIFVTHGLYADLPLDPGQTLVNLWHGMPLKRICRWVGPVRVPNMHLVVSTSPVFQRILAYAFDVPEDRVLVTGQPRCDLMFERADHLGRLGIRREDWPRIILWTPTFRDKADPTLGLPVVGSDLSALDAELSRRDTLLLIKLHPADALNRASFRDYTHVRVFRSADFRARGAVLEHVLGEVDCLWTDFSSVYVDFLLTGKPMGFPISDRDAYAADRGFIFDDVEAILPGPILETLVDLAGFLDQLAAGVDPWHAVREERNAEFNSVERDACAHLMALLADRG